MSLFCATIERNSQCLASLDRNATTEPLQQGPGGTGKLLLAVKGTCAGEPLKIVYGTQNLSAKVISAQENHSPRWMERSIAVRTNHTGTSET